ncbi:hypothetical protein [Limibacterium fermenti]|uniref:hypothetical protein n=1 Tax=Limibacterium fermenti TaxID=3229863 RepID=UPI003A62B752
MMKKILFVTVIGLIFIAGCTGVKTISTGLENESYLVFVGNPADYRGGVDVSVDENLSFKAEVVKDNVDRPKGKVYAISTGTHTITVSYEGNLIFQKQVFVSAQETKKIILQ